MRVRERGEGEEEGSNEDRTSLRVRFIKTTTFSQTRALHFPFPLSLSSLNTWERDMHGICFLTSAYILGLFATPSFFHIHTFYYFKNTTRTKEKQSGKEKWGKEREREAEQEKRITERVVSKRIKAKQSSWTNSINIIVALLHLVSHSWRIFFLFSRSLSPLPRLTQQIRFIFLADTRVHLWKTSSTSMITHLDVQVRDSPYQTFAVTFLTVDPVSFDRTIAPTLHGYGPSSKSYDKQREQPSPRGILRIAASSTWFNVVIPTSFGFALEQSRGQFSPNDIRQSRRGQTWCGSTEMHQDLGGSDENVETPNGRCEQL